jgi:hypothetical protein
LWDDLVGSNHRGVLRQEVMACAQASHTPDSSLTYESS